MKNKTLKQILEEFDKVAYDCYLTDDNYKKEIKVFIAQSIKDALEACRVGEREWPKLKDGELTIETGDVVKDWNANTTQYDLNVKKFLGEE